MSISRVIFFMTMVFPVLSVSAENKVIISQHTQTNLIELYTSEGCSSCPPADRWLSSLKDSTGLWKEFVPLAFHVDYWDYIGWKDRFASPVHGARQRQYAAHRGISSVYTPGVLQNGKEWRDWYRYRQPQKSPGKNVGQLELDLDQQKLQGKFRPVQELGENLDLHIALLGFDLITEVSAGENENHKLQHDFVVLGYKVERFQRQQNIYQIKTELPLIKVNSDAQAIAAWVSRRNHPNPLQAVGGWLP